MVAEGKEYRFHLIPSGILNPSTLCVIGHGVVVDPRVFLQEVDNLNADGVSTASTSSASGSQSLLPSTFSTSNR